MRLLHQFDPVACTYTQHRTLDVSTIHTAVQTFAWTSTLIYQNCHIAQQTFNRSLGYSHGGPPRVTDTLMSLPPGMATTS